MSLVEFELSDQSNQSLLMLRKVTREGGKLDGFRRDVRARLECLHARAKHSLSHCAVDPHCRETTQSLSELADLLLPIAQFYSLPSSLFGSI